MVARPVPYPTPRRVTRADYHRLGELGFYRGERVQLIHGSVVDMPPIGAPHANAVRRLAHIFERAVGDRALVSVQQPFVAVDDSEPEPDLALLPPGDYSKEHPDRAFLIVEVAESSLRYDLSEKASLYAASNVPEYWVVDVEARAVWLFARPVGGAYAEKRRTEEGAEIAPEAFPEVTVRVAELFV